MSFPANFAWGAATASYQIEGAAFEDGKGWSVWDMFCRKAGAVFKGHTGDVACDHYHCYKEDVAIMKEIGLKAYRLSLSWPRIIPAGTGAVNPKGLDFYNRLIDELLAAKITPYITLFHWDYPYDLYCRGGWLNPQSPEWFAEYTRVVVDALSDRVAHWMTLNEPQCFIGLGHQNGVHAPGDKLGLAQVLRAAHHALLAHGKAVQTIRTYAKSPAQIGFAPVGMIGIPATDCAEDREAARQMMFSVTEASVWNNTWWMDPVLSGTYPEDGVKIFGEAMPQIQPDDLETICQPLDFFGFNHYQGVVIRADEHGEPQQVDFPEGNQHTAFRDRNKEYWAITPESLYWGPKFFWERYHLPIIVTENGMSNIEWVSLDGKVHDPQRIDFLQRYLQQYQRAIDEGMKARGYFVWTIIDNFEWAEAYLQRFGLVYVDFTTQQRILKDSAYWYRDVIASNGANLTQ
ncbi:MAG: GH1 family beta-glucosidase [Candidatus Vecturithrix sp.]|jgi:beta-glucosidase|nr:GH1 family beta-glucosidase [Candidatus Vecturithrix sp.]